MHNAIIMASGMGTRMRPLTETMPKPLVPVHGVPMIETVIEGLKRRKLDNIIVVVGYLKEKFRYLHEKYPDLIFIDNPYFQTINNISSIYVARDYLKNCDCYICESDLYISDLTIFDKTLKKSCYYGKMVPGYSDDWVIDLDANNEITRIGKYGTNRYNMCGICWLSRKDAALVSDLIANQWGKPGYETMFWDEVAGRNLDRLKLTVNPVNGNQIVEIDTVEELEEINGK